MSQSFSLKQIVTFTIPVLLIINLSLLFVIASPLFLTNSDMTDPDYFANQQKEIASENVKSLSSFLDRVSSVSNYIKDYMEQLIVSPTGSARPSYFTNYTVDKVPPNFVYSDKHGQNISYDVSAYKVAPSAYNDPVTFNNSNELVTFGAWSSSISSWINLTSRLDLAFIPAYNSMSEILWTYIGFENGVHRTYPFHSLPKTYDPRVRPWYLDTYDSALGSIAFSTPFIDASTGKVIITASQAVVNSSSDRIGVVGIDFKLDTIQNEVLTGLQNPNSHQFLITADSFIVSHPDFKLPDTTWSQSDLGQSIVSNTYETDNQALQDLINQAKGTNLAVQDKINYGSAGDKLVTLQKLNGTDLIFGLVIDYTALTSKVFVSNIPIDFIFYLLVIDLLVGLGIVFNKQVVNFSKSFIGNSKYYLGSTNTRTGYESQSTTIPISRTRNDIQSKETLTLFREKGKSDLSTNEQKAYLFGIDKIVSTTKHFISDQINNIFEKQRRSLLLSEIPDLLEESIKQNLGNLILILQNEGNNLSKIDYEVLLDFCSNFSNGLMQHLQSHFKSNEIFYLNKLKTAVLDWEMEY